MRKIDLFTLICISGLSWSLLMVGHEIVGHGGAVLLIGGTPIAVDAMYFEQDISMASFWQEKFVRAAGSLINILLAVLATIWLSNLRQKDNWKGFTLWIILMMNFFNAGSYIAFARFIHPGMDWAMFLHELEPAWFWETSEIIFGLSLVMTGLYFGRKFHYYFLDSDGSIIKQKLKILVIPLLTATTLSVTAALIMPTDDQFMMLMGGIGNGFSFLIGMLILALIPSSRGKITNISTLRFNPIIIIISLLTIGFYIFGMSRGIRF